MSAGSRLHLFEAYGIELELMIVRSDDLGVYPIADRLRENLIEYMASYGSHAVHPLVSEKIRWGDAASQRGVISGPINGLFVNTVWLPPPTWAFTYSSCRPSHSPRSSPRASETR